MPKKHDHAAGLHAEAFRLYATDIPEQASTRQLTGVTESDCFAPFRCGGVRESRYDNRVRQLLIGPFMPAEGPFQLANRRSGTWAAGMNKEQ